MTAEHDRGDTTSSGHDRVTDTAPAEDGQPTGPPAGCPPVTSLARYELLDVLGIGGMAEVYRARDRLLDRTVAIKFIHGTDPRLTMRLLREARAQSRIDHPNVCRVLDVGEIEGRAYIAIQFVDGESLLAAASSMSLDEKIAVMLDVVMAIQKAHELGIVHRDLKPGNVMVESTDDGRRVPIVMDFGLARETTAQAGLTRPGDALGTPSYMSPEQARGDTHTIDRRSDIYSLGATLYELLTGRPPFIGESLAELLPQVIHDEPPPPRRLVPSLPVDLETVTLNCLAKDPAQRYVSARALADDLERYLRGEPILGRRPSLWRRLRLRARRNRSLVVLGAWSLAILVVVVALAVRQWIISRSERARTAERMVLAQRLGQEAKEIEMFLRTAYQLPLRDMRPAREQIRARMHAIADTRHDLGALGDAAIHDALGRGHLALHQWREAADELARAGDAGLDAPELHAARGRALGELYHRALEEARRSGDRSWLTGRQRELEARYLTPALAELAASRGSGDNAVYLDALIALYRHDFAAAEKIALDAAARAPWLFEARKLAADAAYGAAMDDFDHGNYDAARPRLEHAGELYADASDFARSDAAAYEAAARTALQRAELEFRQGRSPRAPLEHALDVIERSLRADPDNAPAYTTKAYVLLRWCRTPSLYNSEDQRALHDRIAQAAARAVELDPEDASAWDALGNAHVVRGSYESYHQGDGTPWLKRALDEFGKALAVRPDDPWVNNDLGIAHRWLGTRLDQTGRDPLPEYDLALRFYETARRVDPQYVFACSNQTDLHASIAEHHASRGIDPHAEVEEARRVGEECLRIDPSYDAVLDAVVQSQLSLAMYLLDADRDPMAALGDARRDADRGDRRHPDNPVTWFRRLVAAGIEAQFQVRRGSAPTRALAVGREALTRAGHDSADLHVEAARLDLVEVKWRARTGRDATSLLDAARVEAEKAIELDRQFPDAKVIAAEVWLQIATIRRSHEAATVGLAYAQAALAINSQLARGRAVRDTLERISQLTAR